MDGKQGVRWYMKMRIADLFETRDNEFRATLARLRRGAGHEPGDIPELMGYILIAMPDDMLGKDGIASKELTACYGAMTLLAAHQQGHERKESMHSDSMPLGKAIAALVEDEDSLGRVQNRFNIMATSDDLIELMHHLRGMVQLISDKSVPLDYVDLAAALYDYQFVDRRSDVRLKWGQDFYRALRKKEEDKNE